MAKIIPSAERVDLPQVFKVTGTYRVDDSTFGEKTMIVLEPIDISKWLPDSPGKSKTK